MHRNFWKLFLIALSLFLMLIVYVSLYYLPCKYDTYWRNVQSSSSPGGGPNQSAMSMKKTILFWNSFFEETTWYLPVDTVSLQCPQAECVFTSRHDLLPTVDQYDAIIFHSARPFSQNNGYPRVRHPSQWYIFTSLESPEHTEHNLMNENGFYNLTMSYRLDSDFVWSYGHVLDATTNETVAPHMNPNWRPVDSEWTQNDDNLLASIREKNKSVAWFVSNCHTESHREDLVRGLKAHIDVDTYGHCGNLKCSRFDQQCDDLLKDHYKFYLSFENSLCTDYVTEKLYNAYNVQVVPVVFGGANYTRFAPPHSYINAQDFRNVSALADYLLYLEQTPMEYAKYFWWRRYYKVNTDLMPPFCDVCHYVSRRMARERVQYYEDIHSYWYRNMCKRKSKIQF